MRFNAAIPVTIFTILTSSVLITASVKPTVTDPSPSQLTLRLEPNKKTFALYEPVFVTCTLTNPEPWSIIAEVKGLALVDKYVTLNVQEGDGPESKYYSGVVADAVGPSTRDFSPGQFMVDTLNVFFNDLA